MKKFLRSHLFDGIALIALALTSVAILLGLLFSRTSSNHLIATIYFKNEVVETIDLSKESEEERHLEVKGAHSEVIIAIKRNYIGIEENDCPSKTCIHMSPLTKSGVIVCAYQMIRISVGESFSDVEVL